MMRLVECTHSYEQGPWFEHQRGAEGNFMSSEAGLYISFSLSIFSPLNISILSNKIEKKGEEGITSGSSGFAVQSPRLRDNPGGKKIYIFEIKVDVMIDRYR